MTGPSRLQRLDLFSDDDKVFETAEFHTTIIAGFDCLSQSAITL